MSSVSEVCAEACILHAAKVGAAILDGPFMGLSSRHAGGFDSEISLLRSQNASSSTHCLVR